MNVIPECTKLDIYIFITIAGLILCWWTIPEGNTRSVFSVSTPSWFIRYIYYWNFQFPNNIINIKKIRSCTSFRHRWPQWILTILLNSFGFLALIVLIIWFSNLSFSADLIKVFQSFIFSGPDKGFSIFHFQRTW